MQTGAVHVYNGYNGFLDIACQFGIFLVVSNAIATGRNSMDDRRYMTYEMRAIDDPRYRGKIERRVSAVETCYCGKTVIAANGHATGVKCPRNCEANR